VTLSPKQISWSEKEKSSSSDGHILNKDICSLDFDEETKKLVVRTKNGKNYCFAPCVEEKKPKELMKDWIASIRSQWKVALSPLVEVCLSDNLDIANHEADDMKDLVQRKDFEKVITCFIFNEIQALPEILVHNFPSQKLYPKIDVREYACTKFSSELCKKYLDKYSSFKQGRPTEVVVIDKIKKEIMLDIETHFHTVFEKYDNDFDSSQVPYVSTSYEWSAKQGVRPTMEDRHVHIPYLDVLLNRNVKSQEVSYYAVYDGHGGQSVATYVGNHLHLNIVQNLLFERDTVKAIHEAYLLTQESLKQNAEYANSLNSAGSTSVSILIKGKTMFVSWAGDSLASIFRTDRHDEELIIPPHKPSNPDEKKRIENLGGFISDENGVARTNGVVAVTRAFGNLRHKVIIPEPTIKQIPITGNEEFLVIACDGLWDVMTTQDVREYVDHYKSKNKKFKGIAESLVDEALLRGSTDNVSCVFVEFKF
jgi:serine/threonine protein phosphatase PrpC